MGAIAVPKYYSMAKGNAAICRRIGVKLDGVDQAWNVIAYNIPEGWVQLTNREIKKGVVEAYWRIPR